LLALRDGRPAYELVEAELRSLISVAQLGINNRLPGERELAATFGVSRTTVRQALDALEKADLIRRHPGRSGGTFVKPPRVSRTVGEYGGLSGWLRSQGNVTGMRVVSAKVIGADGRVSRGLAVEPGTFVFSIVRIPLQEGEPLSVEHSNIPVEMFPDLLEQQISDSIGEIMSSRYHRAPIRAIEWLDAVAATPDQASALAVPIGTPLLSVERVTFDEDGHRIEFANDLFRGDRTRVISRSPLRLEPEMAKLER